MKHTLSHSLCKRLRQAVLPLVALAALAPAAQAGTCGTGKILEIKEGGWNSDHLYIKIENSAQTSAHPSSEVSGYIRYRSNSLTPERLQRIRALAYLALAGDKKVRALTHNTATGAQCGDATELNIYR